MFILLIFYFQFKKKIDFDSQEILIIRQQLTNSFENLFEKLKIDYKKKD